MHPTAKALLSRWQSLRDDRVLKRAAVAARILGAVALLLAGFVIYALVAHINPVLIALVAGACGWLAAEVNALRTRITQWPTVGHYLDWQRIDQDMAKDVPR